MRFIILSLFVVLFSGCATILNDDMQSINISSSKEKLKGSIDGVPFTGPGIVNVERAKKNKVIMVETEGCQKQVALQSKVDPVFFINILTGGTFGSTTDFLSERMWQYENQVVIPCS